MGRVRTLIRSCWVGSRRECAHDVTIMTIGIPGIAKPGIQEFLFHCTFCMGGHPDETLAFRWVTSGVYVLSCRFASGPLWLRIFLLSCMFLFVLF